MANLIPIKKGTSPIAKEKIIGTSFIISNQKVVASIEKKVIKIDQLLKDSFLIKKKETEIKRKGRERETFEKREGELEKKKPKAVKGFTLPSLPKVGIIDWIKNFILNTFLGIVGVKLVDFLPTLLKILPVIEKVSSFFIDVGGKLLDGLATFIDWGYKAYDATRGFVKNIFGEGGVKQFDQLSSLLNRFLNLALIAGMIGLGGRGPRMGGPKGGGAKPRPGTGGRPRVTTSGGGRAGGVDVRNPLRQRPQVTTGGKPNFRLPGTGPRITGSGAKGLLSTVRPFLKRIPLPVVGALIDFGLSVALGENPGRAAFRAIGAGLLGAVGAAAGSVVPVAGTFIGGLLGGAAGDAVGGALYDAFFGGKIKSKGGKTVKAAGGGKASKRGRVSRTLTKSRKAKRTLSFTPRRVRPGASIGGADKIQSIFPNPDQPTGFFGWLGGLFGKKPEPVPTKEDKKVQERSVNSQEFLARSNDILGKSNFFGPFFTIAIKTLLGQKPDSLDYKNVGSGLNSWMQNIFKSGPLGFAGGGEVDARQFFRGEDYTNIISKSVEESVSKEVDSTLRDLAKEVSLRGGVGREEMIQKNIDQGVNQKPDPNLDVQSGPTVTGGNADFWTLVAIASLESGSPQGRADVAQSIYNRLASKIYSGKTIKELILAQNQYQPVRESDTSLWRSISDKKSAIAAVASHSNGRGRASKMIEDTAAAVKNPSLQKSAAEFVGGRTDFWAEGLRPPSNGVGYVVRHGHRFGWFVGPAAIAYGRKNPGPAKAPQLGNIVVMGGREDGGQAGVPMVAVKGGKAFPLPKGMIGTGSRQVYGAPRSYGGHAGVDVVEKAPWGRDPKLPVVAYAGGKVVSSSPRYDYKTSGYTSNLTIDHGPFKATYLHMKPSLRPGSMVSPGQKVGNLLDLGNQTHLHFESYNKSGNTFDPTSMLRAAYEKGGPTLDGPHMAMIGERGTEYVIDADSYESTEKVAPGLLDILNYNVNDKSSLQKNMPSIIASLTRYASYEDGSSQEIIAIDDEPMSYNTIVFGGSSTSIVGGGGIDNTDYETLEML